MPVKADSDEVHNVGVVELGHDGRLHEEVALGLAGGQLGQRLHGHRHLHAVAGAVPVQPLVHLPERALAQRPAPTYVSTTYLSSYRLHDESSNNGFIINYNVISI